MKKILLIISICMLLLGIVACGNTNIIESYVDLTLQVGDCYKIENVEKGIEVISLNPEIANVSVTNVVTAIKEGQTKIQLIDGEVIKGEYSVEVVKSTNIQLEDNAAESSIYRISLSETDKRIFKDSNFTLTAKVYKNNTLCEESVVWNFGGQENSIITAVDNKNKLVIQGIGYGKTTVTATIGDFTALCKITVAKIDSIPLLSPTISSLTQTEISWSTVEYAESYKVSVNNGISWQTVEATSFNYGDANPLKIRIVAVGDGISYYDSEESKLTQQNVKFSCGDRLVFYTNKSVSGVVNTDKTTPVNLELFACVNGKEIKINNQEYKLSKEDVVTLNGNTFTPVSEGEVQVSLVDVKDISLTAVVGTPIKTKVDMDTLGFAYKNGNYSELWAYGRLYLLANDIDYAQDVKESEKGLRMTDENQTADMWDRYLVPIAASLNGGAAMGASMSAGNLEWGIFGEVGKDGQFFRAIFDGDNHQIKNAVIPYGSVFCYGQEVNTIINNNFIGGLAYGAKLCNVAFTNLEFEDPIQIANAGRSNPYYSDVNANLNGTKLKANGYISNSGSSIFTLNYGSWQALNNSNYAGLVGSIANAVVENVFVESVMKNATWTKDDGYTSGLIVARIDEDYYENGQIYMGTYASVKNCVAVTSYWNGSNVGCNDPVYNAGMGAIVGRSFTNSTKTVTNCFAVSSPIKDYSVAISATHVFVPFGNVDSEKVSYNCGVYESIAQLKVLQAKVISEISILKQIQDFN